MPKKKTPQSKPKAARPGIAGKANKVKAKVEAPVLVQASLPTEVIPPGLHPAPSTFSSLKPKWEKAGEVPASSIACAHPLMTPERLASAAKRGKEISCPDCGKDFPVAPSTMEPPAPPPAPTQIAPARAKKAAKAGGATQPQIAQAQLATVGAEAVKAVFNSTISPPTQRSAIALKGPVLEVAQLIVSVLAQLQEKMTATLATTAPAWSEYPDLVEQNFAQAFTKARALSAIEAYAKDAAKPFRQSMTMAMELAGLAKDDLGVCVNNYQLRHKEGSSTKVDTEAIALYLIEKGVDPVLVSEAVEHGTKRTPYTFVHVTDVTPKKEGAMQPADLVGAGVEG